MSAVRPAALIMGRYRPVDNSLAVGGFGHVVRWHDTFLDREVLCKTMHDTANNGQLLAEIRALSTVRSRHVVEIYDVAYNNGQISGIVIEFLRGRDFSLFHQELAANPEGLIRIIYQIASALTDLHAAGIVHRDLKLDNFRESSSGILKLFDFGISTIGSGYQTTDNRGTLGYAAPELFQHGAVIVPEMDIYALGACAWALATTATPPALTERPPQSSGPPPSLRTALPAKIPTDLCELLDRCLAVNPSARPTAAEVQRRFGEYLIRGRHSGLFVLADRTHEISSTRPQASPRVGPHEIRVQYDGLNFTVVGVSGTVFINNVPAAVGINLPEACVLTFGIYGQGESAWAPFFSSRPEVVL